MRATSIIVLGLLIILGGCKNNTEFQITIETNRTNYDTLFIQELITGRTIAKVPLDKFNKNHSFKIDEATLGSLSVIGTETTYLTIIRPGVKKTILIDSTSLRTKQSIPDSLANYLWKSTNQMFSLHGKVIFAQDNPEKVKSIFDSLVQVRQEQLNKFESQLTADELGILDYQNKARAYSFLMFYGRIIKHYSPDNDFFSFISKINNENIYSKSLPDNLLFKYEIEILKEQDSIKNIDTFLKFIETQTTTKDLQDFLKAMYLKSVIEQPSYWRRHEKLFTTNTIKEALERESTNKYSYLINKASNSFYASQKGVKGHDFTAFKLDGTELKLSDLKGKIVVIDTWATWCGPCIDQRPNMIELAKKHKDNRNIVFLMVSVDSSVDRWKKYVTRTNENQYGIEVNIPDGMNGEFGDKYFIKAIPKYFLIDKDGFIVDSNLSEPSIGMERLIQSLSEKL
jgi:thiol-disulfide isomerase/thioredoxin